MIPRQLLTVLGAAVEPLEAVLDSAQVLDGVLADVGIVVAITDAQRDEIATIAGLDAFRGIGELVAAARGDAPLDVEAVARLTGAVTAAVDGFAARWPPDRPTSPICRHRSTTRRPGARLSTACPTRC